MRVFLRYDDYSELSAAAFERKLFEAIREHGAKLVAGVVPFIAQIDWPLRGPIPLKPLSKEKAALLREFMPDTVEPILHGYCHQTVTRWTHLFEFGDRLTLEQQSERLRDGRNYLEDLLQTNIRIFAPPWNEYGNLTLAALRQLGFQAITADAGFGLIEDGLAYVPSTCIPGELSAALDAASRAGADSGDINVLIHDYDFAEMQTHKSCTDFPGFSRLLVLTHSRGADFRGIGEALADGDWSAPRARANQELRKALQSPLRRLFPRGVRSVYWSEAHARKLLRRLKLLRLFA